METGQEGGIRNQPRGKAAVRRAMGYRGWSSGPAAEGGRSRGLLTQPCPHKWKEVAPSHTGLYTNQHNPLWRVIPSVTFVVSRGKALPFKTPIAHRNSSINESGRRHPAAPEGGESAGAHAGLTQDGQSHEKSVINREGLQARRFGGDNTALTNGRFREHITMGIKRS